MSFDPETLVVQPDVIAAARGIVNPSQVQLDAIADAILDAQADVEGFLNRPLVATTKTLTEIRPVIGADLDTYSAWPDCYRFDDDVAVVSRTAHDDGTYDVEFRVGLDGPNTRPIVRYVKAHAIRLIREDPAYGFPEDRIVNNLAADGQSIGFVARPSGEGEAGALPTMKSLRQFKRMAVFKRDRAQTDLWPNAGARP